MKESQLMNIKHDEMTRHYLKIVLTLFRLIIILKDWDKAYQKLGDILIFSIFNVTKNNVFSMQTPLLGGHMRRRNREQPAETRIRI